MSASSYSPRPVPPPRDRLPTRPSESHDRALPLPHHHESSSVEAPASGERRGEPTSTRFRYDWLRAQGGVIGYAVRGAAEGWTTGGDITERAAERVWYVSQLAAQLEGQLGFLGSSRTELVGSSHSLCAITAPDGTALVLRVTPETDLEPLLRTLGGES